MVVPGKPQISTLHHHWRRIACHESRAGGVGQDVPYGHVLAIHKVDGPNHTICKSLCCHSLRAGS